MLGGGDGKNPMNLNKLGSHIVGNGVNSGLTGLGGTASTGSHFQNHVNVNPGNNQTSQSNLGGFKTVGNSAVLNGMGGVNNVGVNVGNPGGIDMGRISSSSSSSSSHHVPTVNVQNEHGLHQTQNGMIHQGIGLNQNKNISGNSNVNNQNVHQNQNFKNILHLTTNSSNLPHPTTTNQNNSTNPSTHLSNFPPTLPPLPPLPPFPTLPNGVLLPPPPQQQQQQQQLLQHDHIVKFLDKPSDINIINGQQ
jgi:hypothetical protein